MATYISPATSLEFDSGGSNAADDNDSSIGDDSTSQRTQSVTSSVYEYRFEDGRRYHAYQEGQYMMPNDDLEQDRLDLQHHLFRLTLDGALNLAPVPQDLHNVLDIGGGTGIWAIQFAEEHPSANVLGIDLSPIQPNALPVNCSFRVDDAEADWIPEERYDYIHSRAMVAGIKDWPRLFEQAYEHLNPGGWLELQDFCLPAQCDDPRGREISKFIEFTNHIIEAIRRNGVDGRAALAWPDQLAAAGFTDISVKWTNWPIGPWAKHRKNKLMGRWTLVDFYDVVEATRAMFTRGLGWSAEQVQDMVREVRQELTEQRIHTYQQVCFTYARKPPLPSPRAGPAVPVDMPSETTGGATDEAVA